MANLNSSITNVVNGDNFEYLRAIDNLEPNSTIVKAWLTVKELPWDSEIIFQKEITTALSDEGQIYDDGTGDLVSHLRINLFPEETGLLSPYFEYAYALRVETSSGNLYTIESGFISTIENITE